MIDEYVDWLIDAGYPIQRITDYDAWLQRFETAMRALPEQQRQHSLLPLLHAYQRPEKPNRGSIWPADRFRSAVQEAKIGADKDIPLVQRVWHVECGQLTEPAVADTVQATAATRTHCHRAQRYRPCWWRHIRSR